MQWTGELNFIYLFRKWNKGTSDGRGRVARWITSNVSAWPRRIAAPHKARWAKWKVPEKTSYARTNVLTFEYRCQLPNSGANGAENVLHG